MVSTKPFCLIIIPLALLVLLLPAAKAYYPPGPVFYESCDWYGPPNITANPPRKNKYVVNVMSFDETFGVQPVSFNLTAHTDKRLPGGRAVIQLMPSSTGKTITRNVDLCSLTRGGCPIHHGNFTVSFNLSFDGFYQVQFSMFAKSGELLTCVFFEESDPTKMPSEPIPPSGSYEPTPAPSESHEPTLAPSESYEPTPAPSESHEPTPAPSESHETAPAPSEPSQGQAEPPTTAKVWYESCDWYGPPNITENPPPENSYRVGLKSFDMSRKKLPISHNLTANIDKLLPGGRAVTQLMSAMTGKTTTMNVDLCSLTRGGCPIQPGDFTVSFDLYIDYFTQIQFSMFAGNGELLLCVFFEESG